jgi:uncharacterized membrane protein
MVDIRHEGSCDAPLDVTFAYCDDYRRVADWMFGVAAFGPAEGAKDQGLGAVFDATFSVKPVRLSSTIEVTDWVHEERIAFRSITGFSNSSTWHFAADGPERTTIRVVFSYDLPGGLAGKVLGRALEPIVALTVRQSDQALRREIEAAYAARRA